MASGRLCVALMALVIGIAPVTAETVLLVEDGRPRATIVVSPAADAKVVAAAKDLQQYVREITGTMLPMSLDGKPAQGTGIYVGQCEPTAESDLPDAGLNPESYAIRVRDGNLFLNGRWPTPTCFAVYSFIEDDLGVRWFAPGDLWEYVPRVAEGRLAPDVRSRVVAPDTSPRVWSGHSWTPEWVTWQLRNKTAVSEVVPRRNFQNFLHKVFPPEQYAETHPEYYPLVGGKRYIPKPGEVAWRPCESNPDVLRLTVEYARKWFDENPNVDSFSLGMDDIEHLCGCPNCRALDASPDSYEKRQFSDRHYKFVNAVAREVAKTHPDRYIGTLIYWIALEPPKTVERLEDNVFGYITETSALWWNPDRRNFDQRITTEWRKRAKHLSRYDYYGMGTFVPRVYPHTMAEQVKRDKELGFEGMYTEVYTFLPHTAPMIWAFAKLQWDHTLDIDALLGEFYEKMYGPAAPIMKEYFDLLERAWNTPRPGREAKWVHRNIERQAMSIGPDDVDAGLALLEKALASTQDANIRARIEIHHAALRFAGYAVKAYACTREIESTEVNDETSAQRVLRLSEEIARLARERQPFWAACMERNDLLGDNLRGLYNYRKYLQIDRVGRLERGLPIGIARGLAWYRANQPDAYPAILARIEESVGKDTIEAALRAQ